MKEIQNGVSEGFSEFTLLGQNVNSYRTPNGKFPRLLERVASIDGVKRVRFSSPHPQDVDNDMLEVMSSHENICNHVHLPLQSGNDRILKRIGQISRNYIKGIMIDNIENKAKITTANSDNEETRYSSGNHPNSRANLRPWEPGTSGNPSGKNSLNEKLRQALNAIGDEETFNYKDESEGTKRNQVLEVVWHRAIRGDLKYVQLLAGLGCLDKPQ